MNHARREMLAAEIDNLRVLYRAYFDVGSLDSSARAPAKIPASE
jgi:hypothetical protein